MNSKFIELPISRIRSWLRRHSNPRNGRAAVLLGALVLLAMTGCTHVSPWKRGALADPIMQADRDPLGGMLTEHMWFSREAATGGRGVGGGGCGCN